MEPLKARMDFELPGMSAEVAEAVAAALRAEVAADRPVRVSRGGACCPCRYPNRESA
jgi:hypothetical protein